MTDTLDAEVVDVWLLPHTPGEERKVTRHQAEADPKLSHMSAPVSESCLDERGHASAAQAYSAHIPRLIPDAEMSLRDGEPRTQVDIDEIWRVAGL